MGTLSSSRTTPSTPAHTQTPATPLADRPPPAPASASEYRVTVDGGGRRQRRRRRHRLGVRQSDGRRRRRPTPQRAGTPTAALSDNVPPAPRSQNDQNESIPSAAVGDATVSITNAPPTGADGRFRVRTDSDEHSAAHENVGHSCARQHPPAVPPGAPRQRPTSLSRTGVSRTGLGCL